MPTLEVKPMTKDRKIKNVQQRKETKLNRTICDAKVTMATFGTARGTTTRGSAEHGRKTPGAFYVDLLKILILIATTTMTTATSTKKYSSHSA